ncbi:MAG: tetratricopeptide repeat protein [Deltaproteobacteria bacterium]|jgi:tetratricopeptide (TPR) repeat protein|nr:tetratricopeptide repeat protein [Deltaproteobacteria bacterium]
MSYSVRKINRFVLLLVFSGLVLMFVASFSYRLSNPSLFKSIAENRSGRGSQSGQSMGQGMDPKLMEQVGELMAKLKENPNHFETRMALAELFATAQDPASAAVHLQKAVSIKPDDAQAHFNLGVVRHDLEQFAEAAAGYERSLSLEESPITMYYLATVYFEHLNKRAEARKLFERVAANAESPDFLRERARLALKMFEGGQSN